MSQAPLPRPMRLALGAAALLLTLATPTLAEQRFMTDRKSVV